MALDVKMDSGFEEELRKKYDKIVERIIMAMERAGENFIKAARQQPGDHGQGYYEDKTGNLRNSIGYYIFHNGNLIHESEMGNAIENKMSIRDIIKREGFQLIGIAGKDYASHVESRGYNVISVQKDACIIDLTTYFKDIEKYIDKAA